ncbi:Innexin domain containing protein, partial [Asbolus verrucosus]
MLDIFRGLKSLIRVNHIHTDSPVFRLHYSITVLILIAFSLIVTTRQYVGNPIDCIHTKDIPEDVLNTFCWIHSTFTVTQNRGPRAEPFMSYPGVKTSINEKDKKLVRYYQWVCFCLFFQ